MIKLIGGDRKYLAALAPVLRRLTLQDTALFHHLISKTADNNDIVIYDSKSTMYN